MDIKIPTICYMNKSGKSEVTASIHYFGKFTIFFIGIGGNKIFQLILKPLLLSSHRQNKFISQLNKNPQMFILTGVFYKSSKLLIIL